MLSEGTSSSLADQSTVELYTIGPLQITVIYKKFPGSLGNEAL